MLKETNTGSCGAVKPGIFCQWLKQLTRSVDDRFYIAPFGTFVQPWVVIVNLITLGARHGLWQDDVMNISTRVERFLSKLAWRYIRTLGYDRWYCGKRQYYIMRDNFHLIPYSV